MTRIHAKTIDQRTLSAIAYEEMGQIQNAKADRKIANALYGELEESDAGAYDEQ